MAFGHRNGASREQVRIPRTRAGDGRGFLAVGCGPRRPLRAGGVCAASTPSTRGPDASIHAGLGEPLPCSAIHGYGVAEVLDAVLPAVDNAIELRRQQIEQLDAQEAIPRINVALLGRPNVGKSSLMNRFLGPGEQRSIVSDVAGTTRDAVDAELGAPAHQVRQLSHVDGLIAKGQA